MNIFLNIHSFIHNTHLGYVRVEIKTGVSVVTCMLHVLLLKPRSEREGLSCGWRRVWPTYED